MLAAPLAMDAVADVRSRAMRFVREMCSSVSSLHALLDTSGRHYVTLSPIHNTKFSTKYVSSVHVSDQHQNKYKYY